MGKHALLCQRWKIEALLATLRRESWLEKSRRCSASPPLLSLDLSLMALLVYLAPQPQRLLLQRTKRNLAFSKPCSPCSSLQRTPPPPPQRQPPPSVVVCWEVVSLVVRAMMRQPQAPQQLPQQPPPPQPHQPQPPQSVEAFLEEGSSARLTTFFYLLKQNQIEFANSWKQKTVLHPLCEVNSRKNIAHGEKILSG